MKKYQIIMKDIIAADSKKQAVIKLREHYSRYDSVNDLLETLFLKLNYKDLSIEVKKL